MNRILRVIVPLLLAVAVLLCMAWYFLIYDQALTKELLLWGARYAEQTGRTQVATWLYNITYDQSHQDDDVAIELAHQYRAIGNYTKAEYTLSQAISKNPTAKLYMALSQIYVEQDKLQDAVAMLDSVADANIRADLEQIRPAAPQIAPDPGFYSTYISVAFKTGADALYVSFDGEIPSVHQDAYTENVTLPAGETTVYALSIADNGLVSPLAHYSYTVTGVIEPVTFADAAMESAIRAAIGAEEDGVIYTNALWDVKQFTVPSEAKSYKDLVYLPYLTELFISNGRADQLSVLNALDDLTTLLITETPLSDEDLTAISACTGLTTLTLSGCDISSVSKLETLKNLVHLDLSANALRNIIPLAAMPNLQTVDLSSNAVKELSALSGLAKLETLNLSFNNINDLSPLYGLTNLKILRAGNNQISAMDGVGSWAALETLDLSYNNISNAAPIASCTALTELNLSHNNLTDIPALTTLPELRLFNISYNQIPALPEFSPESKLVSIDLSYNAVLDLEALTGLKMLNSVNADYNPDLESLAPLDKCPVLIRVNAYGTKVTEVKFLTEKSVIVNFDPTLKD